jgi:hypothetical protein
MNLDTPTYTKASRFVTREVPFVTFGNHRGLTDFQLASDPGLMEFFLHFKHCFKRNEYLMSWVYDPYDELQDGSQATHPMKLLGPAKS